MRRLRYSVYAGDKFELAIKGVKHVLNIEQDVDSEDPRNWEPLATMLCWHRGYSLGDENNYDDIHDVLYDLCKQYGLDADSICAYRDDENTAKQRDGRIMEDLKDHVCIKFLYLYDHGGITISTDSFRDPWDSGIVGIIYLDKDTTIKEQVTADEISWYEVASSIIEEEVDTYDQWIKGEVYGFTLETLDKCPHCNQEVREFVDSMGGFYGNDILTNGMLDYLPEEFEKYFSEVQDA